MMRLLELLLLRRLLLPGNKPEQQEESQWQESTLRFATGTQAKLYKVFRQYKDTMMKLFKSDKLRDIDYANDRIGHYFINLFYDYYLTVDGLVAIASKTHIFHYYDYDRSTPGEYYEILNEAENPFPPSAHDEIVPVTNIQEEFLQKTQSFLEGVRKQMGGYHRKENRELRDQYLIIFRDMFCAMARLLGDYDHTIDIAKIEIVKQSYIPVW